MNAPNFSSRSTSTHFSKTKCKPAGNSIHTANTVFSKAWFNNHSVIFYIFDGS